MKKIIQTNKAPLPIGAYSQALLFGGVLYLSGQIAIDPGTNTMVTGTIEQETKQVIENILNVLIAAGSSLDNVLKTTCYLADMADFQKFNKVYEEYFAGSKPARSTVQAAYLPKGARVEIDVIAYAQG